MKKIYVPMIRYGDKDFDEGFIGWGFNSYDEQMRDARTILNLVGKKDMKILDVGCGLASYHKVWLDAGHQVTGIDLSDTFIFMANQTNGNFPNAEYRIENYYDLTDEAEYDLITMIDCPVEDAELCENVFRALKPNGNFIFQVSNPLYHHIRGPFNKNHRNWVAESDEVLTFTKNEYNEEFDGWEYEEWIVNVEKSEITIQHCFAKNLSFEKITDIILDVGFSRMGFYDWTGRAYNTSNIQPKVFYGIAFKAEQ